MNTSNINTKSVNVTGLILAIDLGKYKCGLRLGAGGAVVAAHELHDQPRRAPKQSP